MAEAEQVADVSQEEAPSEELEADDWRAQLPEELRDHSALTPIQDVGNLAKSYVNAQSMIGRDKVAIPGQHSSPEDWDEVYTRLGRPETMDGYEIDFPADSDDGFVGWYKTTAHKIGLNNAQVQQLANDYGEYVSAQVEANAPDDAAIQVEQTADLKKQWGSKFDENITLSTQMLREFWPGENIDWDNFGRLDGVRLGDNKDFIAAFAAVGEFIRSKISEDAFEGMTKPQGGMLPSEVDDQLLEVERADSPLWDAQHPQHKEFVSRRDRLFQLKYPEDE